MASLELRTEMNNNRSLANVSFQQRKPFSEKSIRRRRIPLKVL